MPLFVFEGDNIAALHKALREKVDAFSQEFGDYNVARINLNTHENLDHIEEEIDTEGFLAQERLIILSNLNIETGIVEDGGNISKQGENMTEKLLLLFKSLPPHVTVVLVNPHVDARMKFAKFLAVNAIHTKFHEVLFDGHSNIPPEIRTLIENRTTHDIHERKTALEKVSLYSISTPPNRGFIDAILPPERDAVIFTVIDALLIERYSFAQSTLHTLIEKENIWIIYSSLISNIRTALYILVAREMGENKIAESFGIHPFVVKKTQGTRGLRMKLQKFLSILIHGEIAQKRGKGFSDPELGLLFSIDRGLIELQKMKKGYTLATY